MNKLDKQKRQHGKWSYFYKSGSQEKCSEENYIHGKLTGAWRRWYADGTKAFEGYWLNDEKEGEEIKFYEIYYNV